MTGKLVHVPGLNVGVAGRTTVGVRMLVVNLPWVRKMETLEITLASTLLRGWNDFLAVWLEDFLQRWGGTLIFVTHDREFLQRMATRIVELDRGRLFDWASNYQTFVQRKEAMLSAEQDPDGPFTLTWSSVGGTRYRVQYSNGDTGGGVDGPFGDIVRSIDDEMDPSPYGTASTQSFSLPSTNTARFYRIQVVR